ncbi:MAG TPA: hypothetical protein VFQ71_14070, partial [Gaiellales bacterium]|nr:hypothetical protein [Gaiellales bacterium]
MTEKRKNLLILLLVLAVAAASAAAVSVKGFTQGLDLKGGLQVVLKAEPKAGQTVTSTELSQAANVMRNRIDPQGVKQPEIVTSPSDNTIEISMAGVTDPNAVSDLLTAGELLNFDMLKWTNKVSQQNGRPYTVVTHDSSYSLLRAADRQAGAGGAASAEQWGLFDRKTQKPYKRTELLPQKQQVLGQAGVKAKPPGTVWLYVPKGTFAVSCNPVVDGSCYNAQATSGTFWYLFNRPPANVLVTGHQISSAQSTTDQNGQPIVAISYKNGGAQTFQAMTKQTVDTAN